MKPKKRGVCVHIVKAPPKSKHKLVAHFKMPGSARPKKVAFGARGYSDFTKHKDPERKRRYLNRHRKNEDWQDYDTPGALSRFVLWNLPDLKASIDDYARRFRLSKCVSPAFWGAKTWNILHVFARGNPPQKVRQLTTAVSLAMPCRICRGHFQRELRGQKLKKKGGCCDADDLIELHNSVNRRLGKRVLPKSEARAINKRRTWKKAEVAEIFDLFLWNIERQGLGGKMSSRKKRAVDTLKVLLF
jgi:hypothetical protein